MVSGFVVNRVEYYIGVVNLQCRLDILNLIWLDITAFDLTWPNMIWFHLLGPDRTCVTHSLSDSLLLSLSHPLSLSFSLSLTHSHFLSFSLSHFLSLSLSLSLSSTSSNAHVLVDYEEVPSLSLHQRVALWLAADVFLLTTVREGLNLYPLEYICARKQLGKFPHFSTLPSSSLCCSWEFSDCFNGFSTILKSRLTNVFAQVQFLSKTLFILDKYR